MIYTLLSDYLYRVYLVCIHNLLHLFLFFMNIYNANVSCGTIADKLYNMNSLSPLKVNNESLKNVGFKLFVRSVFKMCNERSINPNRSKHFYE